MYVQQDKKLIYLAHPRTASNATVEALKKVGFVKVGGHHAKADELPTIIDPNDYYKFTTVRNHWDAAVSLVFAAHSMNPFVEGRLCCAWDIPAFERGIRTIRRWTLMGDREERIKNDKKLTNKLWCLHSDDVDCHLLYHRLEENLNDVLNWHDLDPVEIPKINVTKGRKRDYRSYYNDTTRNYIFDRYRDEIERFGFTF